MLFVIEEIVALQHALLIHIGVGVDVEQKFDLIQGLIYIVLIVGYHLHAVLLASRDILHFDCRGELGTPQDIDYPVLPSQDLVLGDV